MTPRFSVKSKIVMIALTGLISFGSYLAINTQLINANKQVLSSLSSQELKAIAIHAKLEKNIRTYKSLMEDAISYEDSSIVEEGEPLAEDILYAHLQLEKLLPKLNKTINTSETNFINLKVHSVQFVEHSLDENSNLLLTDIIKSLINSIKKTESSSEILREKIYSSFEDKVAIIQDQQSTSFAVGYAIGAVLFIVCFALTLYVSRSVGESIKLAVEISANIAKGDLSKKEYSPPNDDIGEMLHSLDLMRNNIKETQRGLILSSNFSDAISGVNSEQALSTATNALRELFNLPCTALYILSSEAELECLSIDSLDKKNLNAELFEKLDIANNCLVRNVKTTFVVKNIGDNITFDFMIGTAELLQIDAHPIIYNNICIGVLLLTYISEPEESDSNLIDQCLEKLAQKVHTFTADRERSGLHKSLTVRAQELEVLNKENKIISKTKSEFLACMSHEIRTPINGVTGMLNLLKKSDLSGQQHHYTDIALDCTSSLLELINDILDFSKIEAGKLDLEYIDFDLRAQLGNFVKSMALQAQSKGLNLIIDLTEFEESSVCGDSARIRQILINLVSNAIKFTETGEIVVKAKLEATQDSHSIFSCSVSDSGIGIPQDKIAKLFESFSQADSSTTRKYGGTGLGLSIAKQLCTLMGGDLSATSTFGQGSTFSFNIKLQQSSNPTLLTPPADISASSILVADENLTNCTILAAQLEHWGARVVTVRNGIAALSAMEINSRDNKENFSLAIVNMQLEDMSGTELGSKIRSNSQYDAMKMVLMVPMSENCDSTFFTDHGFSYYLRKPIITDDIFDAINILMGVDLTRTTRHLTDGHTKKNHPKFSLKDSGAKILLVEDNMVNQFLALGLLEDFGLTADTACDGEEALALLCSAPDDKPYTLILMDCQMPKMDGYETTRYIRQGKAGQIHASIPILAMTANAMKGDQEKCLNAGMSDYITKPIDPDVLENRLHHWINEKSGKKPTLASTTDTQEKEEVSMTTENNDAESSSTPVWDRDAILKRLRGKAERIPKYIHLFLEDVPNRIEGLEAAVKQGNTEEISHFAHTIKGVSGNLGGMLLHDECAKVEAAGREGNAEEAAALMPALLEQYKALKTCLEMALLDVPGNNNDASSGQQPNSTH